MEDWREAEDLSLLPSGARIPAGETWSGSPAQKRLSSNGFDPAPARSRLEQLAVAVLYLALVLAFPLIELPHSCRESPFLTRFHPDQALFYLAAPLAGACFIVCVTAEVVISNGC